MEKTQGQLPYPTPAFPTAPPPTLFLGILEVPGPARKRAVAKPKRTAPPPQPLPGRRVTFLDISPKTKV